MSRYLNHQGEALSLFDAAEKKGWVDRPERWRFEHPTNPLGVEHIAQLLATWGAHL